jgi:hypothetical protein
MWRYMGECSSLNFFNMSEICFEDKGRAYAPGLKVNLRYLVVFLGLSTVLQMAALDAAIKPMSSLFSRKVQKFLPCARGYRPLGANMNGLTMSIAKSCLLQGNEKGGRRRPFMTRYIYMTNCAEAAEHDAGGRRQIVRSTALKNSG